MSTKHGRARNLSRPFILRPVGTTLMLIGLGVMGVFAFVLLPVSTLPQVAVPTISVQAALPGAGPETMAQSVATPLERQLGRIPGVSDISSKSALGTTAITLQFDLDRDVDGAARDVQAALNAARAQLPSGMPSAPTYRKVNPGDTPILVLALTSSSLAQPAIYEAASTVLAQRISQVKGVGNVSVQGSSPPAVRVSVNPTALGSYGIGLATVKTAIQNATALRPMGALDKGDRSWLLTANDQLKDAAQYRDVIVSTREGAPVRLGDVAEVSESSEDVRTAGFYNGDPAVLVIVNKQPDANIMETVGRIYAVLPKLRASLPGDLKVHVAIERTTTIRASLRDAEETLLISSLLVIGVVVVFLRDWRAALVPAIIVPLSLAITFAVMYACGYSLDNFSLMALIVATGFVVDDVVVMLENVSRHLENGSTPLWAAINGSGEVGFTIVSMTLSLVAVFLPILFFPGVVGRYFREFAVTLTVAVMVSMVLAMTVAPMLCSRLMRRRPAASVRQPDVWQRFRDGTLRFYRWSLTRALARPLVILCVLLGTVLLNVHLYRTIEKGFFPPEDTGRLYAGMQTDTSVSFRSFTDNLVRFMRIIKADPAVDGVSAYASGPNDSLIFASLRPASERDVSTAGLARRVRKKLGQLPGADMWLQPAHDIRIGSRQDSGGYQYTLRSDSTDELAVWAPKVQAAMEALPQLIDVDRDEQDEDLQSMLQFDRTTASRLGVSMDVIDDTLSDAFSQRQVATLYGSLDQRHVILEVAPRYLGSPQALDHIYVPSLTGASIPLMSFARVGMGLTSTSISHSGQFVASTISFDLADGTTLDGARHAIDRQVAGLRAPASVHGSFEGDAGEEERSGSTLPWLIAASLVAIYVILGVLYESFIHPLTILSTLPSAGIGALVALQMCGMPFTLIAFLGILLLIGIVKKNAIMMIDYAVVAERQRGLSTHDAIVEACLHRFRPIMMTTLAALLGALPLAFGSGEGRELRQPLGVSIVGGLVVCQVLTLYTTPVVYLCLDRLRLWGMRRIYKHVSVRTELAGLDT